MISVLLGLGNVGSRYVDTRHNVGFMVMDKLFNHFSISPESAEEYEYAVYRPDSEKLILAKPTRYMNNSGFAADALLKQNNLTPNELLVILDDFNLPLGKIRVRQSGSDGGHNGLASITEQLESDDFPRLRIGIGLLPEDNSASEFVLSKFTEEENETKNKMIEIAFEAILFILDNGLDEAMAKYNRNPA
jgi:PTH1 family peptidyl-tRNA hydrolase